MDKLIKYVNGADVGLNLIYSTPSCYLKAKNDELDELEEVVDDFFPYADGPHMFWEWLSIKYSTLKSIRFGTVKSRKRTAFAVESTI